jgi:hypothetical protein
MPGKGLQTSTFLMGVTEITLTLWYLANKEGIGKPLLLDYKVPYYYNNNNLFNLRSFTLSEANYRLTTWL